MDEQENGVPRWAVRIETKLAELTINTERNDRHLLSLRQDFTALRDLFQAVAPRIQDHTGRIHKIEEEVAAHGVKAATWQGAVKGVALLLGGLVAGATLVIAILQVTK